MHMRKEICVQIVCAAVLVIVSSVGLAAADISLPTTVTSPVTTVIVSVDFSADRRVDIAAVQFDVLYDPTVLTIAGITPGDAAVAAGKAVSSAVVAPGQLRVLVLGLNRNVMSSGTLANVVVQVGTPVKPGPSSLQFAGVVGVDPDGGALPLGAYDGRIVIVPKPQ